MKKSCSEKEGHPPAESTEKIVDSFARANRCSVCLTWAELTQLGEPKCLYGQTLDQLGGWLYLDKLGGSPFWPSQLFFFTFTRFATFFTPLNHKINIWTLICCPYSFLREVVGIPRVILSVILMTTLFYKALILQREVRCWSLLGLKGLRERMKSWPTQGISGRQRIDTSTRYNFSPYKWT